MSISQRAQDIIDQIITQLQLINGDDDYNFNINHNSIVKGGRLHEDFNDYPGICIAAIDMVESEPADQVHFNVPVRVDIIGYVKHEYEAFKQAINLSSDIEKAIYTSPELNGKVWSLKLGIEVSSFREVGEAIVTLDAMSEYTII